MKIAICTIGKLENNYIREFVEYHKNLGFDNIIINDNNDIDGENFNDVISDYINTRYVILRNVRGLKKIQSKAYTDTYNEYGHLFDYMLFIDIDEFVVVECESIKKELENKKYNNYEQIRLYLRTATDSNNITVIDNNYSVISRFTEFIPEHYGVSIIKTGLKINYINCHGVKNLKSCDIYGNKIVDNERFCILSNNPPIYDILYVNHYSFKSLQEYLLKISRGYPDGQTNLPSLDNFFKRNKKTPEKLEYLKSIGIEYK